MSYTIVRAMFFINTTGHLVMYGVGTGSSIFGMSHVLHLLKASIKHIDKVTIYNINQYTVSKMAWS